MTKQTYFFKDKPLFGLDIGHGTLKAMQITVADGRIVIDGYGKGQFEVNAITDGIIVDQEAIVATVRDMLAHNVKGKLTARHVAMAIPGHHIFSRAMQLPNLNDRELWEAIQLEIEQYIPVPLQELYLDYTTIRQNPDGRELFIVAVPKKIVDSYVALATALDLEPILIEPTMAACARLFLQDKQSNMPSVLIDLGSLTADISIFNGAILTTSTVAAGGTVFTEAIRTKMQVSPEEAKHDKTEHGLDPSAVQQDVAQAVEPALQKLVTEIRRMIRYYEERYGSKDKIQQVVMMGGGANMPGLSTYLTDALKLPVRTHNHPWAMFEHDKDMKLPTEADRLMFATVAGLGLVTPKEVFKA